MFRFNKKMVGTLVLSFFGLFILLVTDFGTNHVSSFPVKVNDF